MTFHGLFWSAVIRSILSLRRDMQATDQADSDAIAALPLIESHQFDKQETDVLLTRLIPIERAQRTGQSLAGYFDFNKMGNLVVYMTSTKDIQHALDMLIPRSHSLMPGSVTQSITDVPALVTLTWQSDDAGIQDEILVYFLLVLFRHLAGRRFDFDQVTLQAEHKSILNALSNAPLKYSQQVSVTFSRNWLTQPSFFHSPAIASLLEPALALRPLSFEQQLLHAFQKASQPARIRADWVANMLGMSQSALRKSLRIEEISFTDMLKMYTHGLSAQRLLQGEKTDDVATTLGFSDRRSFERSFKAFSGINAGQVRQLGARLRFSRGNENLLSIVDNLPPLPSTIQAIIAINDDDLTLTNVVTLIKNDPIFHAHIMSKAGKAAFGSKVASLEQAVGRNLGVGNIKNLAIMFAAQQQLSEQCRHPMVERLTDAMLLSDTVFSLLNDTPMPSEQRQSVRQQLLFGALAVFLVFHEECVFSDGVLRMWQESKSFAAFMQELSRDLGVCLYGASALMLFRWGFTGDTNHALWHLCKCLENDHSSEAPTLVIKAHDIAFSTIASHSDYLGTDGLAEPQQEKIHEALQKWA